MNIYWSDGFLWATQTDGKFISERMSKEDVISMLEKELRILKNSDAGGEVR